MIHYPWPVRAGTALSQLINAAVFGGHPNVSLSTRAWHDQHKSRFWFAVRVAADWLFGEGHCERSCEEDLVFAHDVYRDGILK